MTCQVDSFSHTGTAVFSPPEKLSPFLVDNSKELILYSPATDIWSLGCILLDLVFKTCPFFTPIQIHATTYSAGKPAHIEIKDQLLTVLLKLGSIVGRDFLETQFAQLGDYTLELPKSIPSEPIDMEVYSSLDLSPEQLELVKSILIATLCPVPSSRPSAEQLEPLFRSLSIGSN